MITGPKYLGGGLMQQDSVLTQVQREQDEHPAMLDGKRKAEAERSMRLQELTEFARNLEYMRQRLSSFDLQVEAGMLDTIIGKLINRWNDERKR